ncbi:MAG: hypothetical protein AAB955_02055 [Patescibacteria group bacterium]
MAWTMHEGVLHGPHQEANLVYELWCMADCGYTAADGPEPDECPRCGEGDVVRRVKQ